MEDSTWYEEKRKQMYNSMQAKIEEEFAKSHAEIMRDLKLTDKGSLRNINNYRMKLWCDVYMQSLIDNINNPVVELADDALIRFDKRFNQIPR
jgi:hypothetical protein